MSKAKEPTDIFDVYSGPEHRGSVEVPRGTDRGRVETMVVQTFGADFDRVTKREEPAPSDT